MAKRGRPAKAGKRYANGHLKPQTEQIPEGLAMRRMAALELSGAERDMRAEYPLGVCRALGLIFESEHEAGLEYVRLHRRHELVRTPQTCIGNLQTSGEGTISLGLIDPEQEAKSAARYLRIRDAAKATGSRPWRALQNVVIHQHWPRFLDTERRRSTAAWLADERDLAALRQVMQVIARAMGLRAGVEDMVSALPDNVASVALRRDARIARERRIPCPKCAARPGELCLYGGRGEQTHHAERVAAAMRERR